MKEVFNFLEGTYIGDDRPAVIKNPYLVGGKGSVICASYMQVGHALAQIREQQQKKGDPEAFLVMEFLEGEEVSITAISDGEHLVYLPPSQDHKRLLDGDKGPMTGGMGAIAPAPYITPELQTVIHKRIMLPTIRAMAEEVRPFKGVLYAGIILTKDGPRVLEFNARFGDPEAQVILPLLKTDIVELMLAAIDGSLDKVNVEIHDRAAACVVLAAEGYGTPEGPKTGDVITGLDVFHTREFCFFHAGTKRLRGEAFVTNGGRVLGATGWGDDLPSALAAAYRGVGQVRFDGLQYRRDIGQRALRHLAGQK